MYCPSSLLAAETMRMSSKLHLLSKSQFIRMGGNGGNWAFDSNALATARTSASDLSDTGGNLMD